MSFGGGALVLMLAARSIGASLRVDKAVDRLHLAVAGLFSTAGFGVLTALAMLNTSTGRTAICAYTMPIWTTLLGRIVLEERLSALRIASLLLGSAGLLVLLWPLLATGIPIGAIAAIGSAISWAMGTVYQKWAGVTAHPLAIAVWQLVAGALAAAIGIPFAGIGSWTGVGAIPIAGLVYTTVCGTAVESSASVAEKRPRHQRPYRPARASATSRRGRCRKGVRNRFRKGAGREDGRKGS